MLEFKKEYFQTEPNRHLYPTTLDLSKAEVYGCKDREAYMYKIPNNRYTSNAGNIDFSLYPNGVWSDYTGIKIVERLPFFQPSINFNKLGDITPSNLNKLKEEIKKHIVDLETAITESVNFIDSGVPGQNNLPYLPEGCVWFRDPIIKDVIALPISDLYGKFNQMVEALKKEFEKVLIAGTDEALIEIIKKFKEETDKQLGILAGAGSAFKPKQVANIEILKNVNAKVDEVYEVLGYYRFDDGATHKRVIADTDDGSGVQLRSGKWANIVHNGEVNVSWFGAKGDGRNEQTIFSKISSYIQNSNFKEIKLIFPYGKTFEYGDQYENTTHSETTPYYITTFGFNISKEDLEIEFDLNYCNFIRKPNLKYGAFNPLTGEKHPSNGYFIKQGYAISCPTFINITNTCKGVKVYNATIDGNNLNDDIGGTYGDTGRQIQCTGVRVTEAKEYIEVNNVHVKNMHLDGFSLSGTTKYGEYKYTKIKDCSTTRCGRMGFTIAGGKNITLENLIGTYCGTKNLPCSSAPKSCCDIENESGSILENVKFIKCHFEEGGNTCIVSDMGDSAGIKIYDSTIINRQGVSLWLNKRGVEIYNSILCGRITNVGIDNYRAKFFNCTLSDHANKYSILKSESEFIRNDTWIIEGYNLDTYKCLYESHNKELDTFVYASRMFDSILDIHESTRIQGEFYGSITYNREYYQTIYFNPRFKSIVEQDTTLTTFLKLYSYSRVPLNIKSSISKNNEKGHVGDIILNNQVRKNLEVLGWYCSQTGNERNDVGYQGIAKTTSGSDIIEITKLSGNWIPNERNRNEVITIDGAVDSATIISATRIKENVFSCKLDKKATNTVDGISITFPVATWIDIKLPTPIKQLDTPYYARKMEKEGVLQEFDLYLDEKTVYDKQQEKIEKDIQLAYQEVLKENPDLTYEEFLSMQPMTLNLIVSEEPQPSEALKKFMEKYL